MTQIREALMASTKFDNARLNEIAVTALERNGASSEKALVSFIGRLRVSPEVRALIGVDHIRDTAMAYLEARAAELISKIEGSAQADDGGGVRGSSDSQNDAGPAVIKPVPVKGHARRKPGEAKRGLAEARMTAKLAPLAFVVRLSNGVDYGASRG